MKKSKQYDNYIEISLQAAPLETVWKLLFLLASGIYPSVLVLISGHMIDTGLGVLQQTATRTQMIQSVFYLCILMLAWSLLGMLNKLIDVRYTAKLTEAVNLAAAKKRARVKYACIEQESTQKLFARISEEPAEHVKSGTDNLLSMAAFALEVAGMLVVISTHAGWVALLYCVCCVPLVLLSLKCGAYDYEIFEQTSDLERREKYYEQILTDRELTEERELFGYTAKLNHKWDAIQAKIVSMTARINAVVSFRLTSAAMLMSLLQVIVMLLLLFPLQAGTLSIGVYLTVVKQQSRLEQKIAWELMEMTETYENCRRYRKDYAEFLALEEDTDALCGRAAWKRPVPTLRFEQVEFCYANREKMALSDVSFSLESGKKYALVGENGAGKTTLVKLLLGMYDSYRGNIYLGDTELRTMEAQEKKACMTVLFQDFFHYEISVRDYLNLGKEQPYEDAKLYQALLSVGLSEAVEALPDGLDTQLGRLQTGVDFSGGQWQKLAAARCTLDNAPLMVLDEPTSAMDALSEKEFYHVLAKAAEGRTALIITHRLGLALYADEILVMEGGRLCNYLVAAMAGAFSGGAVMFLQNVLDTVTAYAAKETGLGAVLRAFSIFLLIKLGEQVCTGIYNVLGETHSEISMRNLGNRIHRKIALTEAVRFEEKESLLAIQKAYRGAACGRKYVNTYLTLICSYVPYYGILSAFLFSQEPVLCLLLFLIFLPSIFAQILKSRSFERLEKKAAQASREMQYMTRCIGAKEAFAETRQLGAFPYFKECLIRSIHSLNLAKKEVYRAAAWLDFLLGVGSLLAYVGVILLLFRALVKGRISLGTFGAMFCSLDSIYEMTQEVISETVSYGVELKERVRGFVSFLNGEEKKQGDTQLGRHGEVTFSHVHFRYPESTNEALTDVNLTLHEGETLAVVGENGSGKTTLVRLLLGIYLPNKGTVSHNGTSTQAYQRDALYQKSTAVFQHFGRYRMTLLENIEISGGRDGVEAGKVTEALAKAGLEQNGNLEQTMLGNEFGGVDLSGGQWQRVAIARSFYREHELIVLDEPTSAIDPIEEKEILTRFLELAADKTAVIVTHRLASVRKADRIAVMSGSRLIACDTHENLISDCELYRRMWDAQARQYV